MSEALYRTIPHTLLNSWQHSGLEARVPCHSISAPQEDEAGVCHVCQDIVQQSISISFDGHELQFCGTGHYYEWWYGENPSEVKNARAKLDRADSQWREKLKSIHRSLQEWNKTSGDAQIDGLSAILYSLDDHIIQTGYVYPTIADHALYQLRFYLDFGVSKGFKELNDALGAFDDIISVKIKSPASLEKCISNLNKWLTSFVK